MIPAAFVTAWGVTRPWPTSEQIEQDLLLSRAICEISEHPMLREELVFRGGTALHKLHLQTSLRYSEDLDYVRTSAGGIQPLTRALTGLGESLGFRVSTRVSAHPKVYWKSETSTGIPLRIKVEINTHERSPSLRPVRIRHEVVSEWWAGTSEVLTFQPEELIATKLRALFQRKKGRDLFDLWLALTSMGLDPARIISAYTPYRPEGYTSARAVSNLREKLSSSDFRNDLHPLLTTTPEGYDIDSAGELIITELLERIS